MRAFISLVFTTTLLSVAACGDADAPDSSADSASGTSSSTSVDGTSTSTSEADTSTSEADTSTSDEDTAGSEADTVGPEADAVESESDTSDEEDTLTPEPQEDLEILGSWDDNYGSTTEISAEMWGYDMLVSYDNEANWAITQVSEDAAWNPGTYSKVVWTEPSDGHFFVCTVDFALETLEDVESSEATWDASSPLEGGCGSFPWTEMRTPLEVKGDWHTNYDENLTLTTFMWGSYESLVYHDNEANWAISRVPDDAEWNPGTYSKVVWTDIGEDGTFWVCTVAYGLETPEDAKADTTEFDDSDPSTGGCGTFAWTHYMPIVEVTGRWHSNYGGEVKVDSTVWGYDLLVSYDNEANWAVIQVNESAEWNPNTYSKLVWTEPEADGSFFYCTVDYALETYEEALAAEDTSDASDPANGGCGGFAWTHFGPLIEVKGSYTSQFESQETIDSDTWGSFVVTAYDNTLNHAVLYTPEDAEWSPDTYSKVVWLEPDWDGSFYYCTVAYDLASAEEAAEAEDISDASDPDNGGCGDFSWTKLTPEL